MNARRLILYLLLNAIVSASATLAVLWAWDRWVRAPVVAVAPSPTSPAPAGSGLTATPGPLPVTPFPTPLPIPPQVHTVQAGETLGAIAQLYGISVDDLMLANNLTDPNVLDVGQRLVIPTGGFEPTAAPAPPTEALATVPPLSTATPNPNAPPPALSIREVQAPGVLDSEAVVIANGGGPVDLTGWTLRDESGRLYTFPALTLFEGGIVAVHTGSGQDTVIDLYWGQPQPAWASGRLVLLADPDGNLSARYIVP
jgi:LysM repeat protein